MSGRREEEVHLVILTPQRRKLRAALVCLFIKDRLKKVNVCRMNNA